MADLPVPDYRVQVSFKLGPFRDDMLNVRADDFDQLAELLDNAPKDIVDRINNVQRSLGTLNTVSAGTQGDVTVVSETTTTTNSGPTVPRCAHGARKFFAKADWQAYFCPRPKGASDQCDPIFKNKENEGDYPWQ